MRNQVFQRRAGEGVVSRWAALGMIVAIMALVMSSFSFAQIASADEIETSIAPAPTRTVEAPPSAGDQDSPAATSTSKTPPTTTKSVTPTTQVGPTKAPATSSSTTPPPTTTSGTATTEKRAGNAAITPRGLNPGIDVEITEVNVTGAGDDQQITVGDSVEVRGTWDARNANPKPGDEFTIQFPDELKLGGNPTIDLKTNETVWGTCELNSSTNVMTCVLSDAVVGHEEEVHGDFFVYTKAVEYTTAKSVDFTINDRVRTVPLPGGGGIGDGQDIGVIEKSGELAPDKAAVRWTIDIPGSDLAALDTGNTGSVNLSDALSANMTLCEDGRLNARLLSGRPGDLKDVPGGVAVTQPDGAGSVVGIELTNGAPFASDKLYRVEYTSCTTSGMVDLPTEGDESIVYDNSVTVGGITVGAVGVGQTWRPEAVPSKSGSLDKNERYREAAWNIQVPGVFIAADPDNKVAITETLTGDHAVCDSGLKVKIELADRLPGPDGKWAARQNVTDDFVVDTSAAPGSKTFTVTITPKAGTTIDEDRYYQVSYRTCLTGDKVPDSTETFTNTALVNGTKVGDTAKGHDFSGRKTGKLNTDPKVIAGETQPAGTTLGWDVEIPGRHLEGRTTPAVITDTFSDTMTVCEVGNDLTKNLDLQVTARDFLGDSKANADRDLTGATTVKRTANGIDFTLPKDAGDYNRETRYYISYTLCTTSGGLDQRGTEYGNALDYEGGAQISHGVKQEWGGGGTGQGVTRGSFSLLKNITSSSEKFPEDTEFTVKVDEFAPGQNPDTDAPASSYEIKVKADGTPVSGLNPRGIGWQIRLSEINLPTVGGVYFEQGKFAAAEGVTVTKNGTEALVSITPKSNIGVTLFNKAQLGTAKITKTVIGDGPRTGLESFTVNAEINSHDDANRKVLAPFTLRDGQFYNLGDLPIGSQVTFTEVQPLNTDLVTWSVPVITPKTLTIGTDAAANTVSITNEATTTQGTFEVSKKLTGPKAFDRAVPASFDVNATWLDADGNLQGKTLTLPSNGTKVPFGENLPGGTEVTLTEVVPADGNGLAYGVPAYSGNVRVGADNAAVVTIGKDLRQVDVTNFVDVNDGTLRVAKQVSGEAAGAVGEGVEFGVQARWKDGVGYRTADLTVKQGEATPLGVDLPVGTEVTFTEIGRPDVAGVEWGTISWGTSPDGESWLVTNPGGTATGIVSDDPTDGRLITLSNEALWKFGSVEFTKFILDGDDAVRATEADLPDGAAFQVRIDGIDPALPAGTDFPAVGETITLDAGNNWSWKSGDVVPRNTVITFSEIDPAPLAGIDWARPYYYVAADAGDADYRDTVTIVAGAEAVVEIHNRPIPTADVDIDKIVTGPKGSQVTKDGSTIFQVTATWTDIDDEFRSCVLDVRPGASVTPTTQCDAAVVDGRVQFPLDTEITFIETGAHTDVTNVKWGEVLWSLEDGRADIATIDGEPTGISVTLTGGADKPVVLGLENKTSSNGLIIIPLPIPLPPWGSLIPAWPGIDGPGIDTPVIDGPSFPGSDGQGSPGHNGAPGKPVPVKPDQSSSLPVTGANVIWLAGAALVLIAGGAWLVLRNRRQAPGGN
ncbi:LPXTG-motif cell wall-anchored protein [Rhodococcus sp. 27YEA15]|uniref:DUF5979 domain-containing protein n=1 Tax=Rhodococcus sp. 27YEA15 TaxID=3156259 RepID=UPI003C7C0C7B